MPATNKQKRGVKWRYNAHRYAIGDRVMLDRDTWIHSKLFKNWDRPYRISQILSPFTVEFVKLKSLEVIPGRMHVNRLKPYLGERKGEGPWVDDDVELNGTQYITDLVVHT